MKRFLKIALSYLVRFVQPEVKTPTIILIGDSLIKLGNWKRLLNRNDLINRGIGGETLGQIQERMKKLRNTTARIIFIEGGINDFPQSNPENLLGLYQEIITFWESKQIIPVLTNVVYISPEAAKKYPFRSNWRSINKQVDELNKNLNDICIARKIDLIDLNSCLSNSIQLRDEFTTDGVHFTEAAYQIWARELRKILQRHQI
ncbi:SGNH/GDSL hydrolase family protein [Spirosoma telluris]